MLRGVDEKERNMHRIVVALFVAVGASTMEHLARGACYTTGSRFWTARTGARGKGGGTVTLKGLTKETLRAGEGRWEEGRRGVERERGVI
jgi:hypothetical protein